MKRTATHLAPHFFQSWRLAQVRAQDFDRPVQPAPAPVAFAGRKTIHSTSRRSKKNSAISCSTSGFRAKASPAALRRRWLRHLFGQLLLRRRQLSDFSHASPCTPCVPDECLHQWMQPAIALRQMATQKIPGKRHRKKPMPLFPRPQCPQPVFARNIKSCRQWLELQCSGHAAPNRAATREIQAKAPGSPHEKLRDHSKLPRHCKIMPLHARTPASSTPAV